MKFSQINMNRQRGFIGWIIAAIVVVVAAVVAVAVGVATTPSGVAADPGGICYTSCSLFVEMECGTGKLVGACFGWWECPAGLTTPGHGGGTPSFETGVGAHICLE